MALLVRSTNTVQRVLNQRCLYWPRKRIDRTKHQHRRIPVPTSLPQHLLPVFLRQWLKGPTRVGTQFCRHTQLAKNGAGLFISCDDERVSAVARAHLLKHRVHVPGFGAVADGKFVLRRRNSQRPDHHRGQRIGELALEHGTFARHYAMMFWDFIRKEWRKNVRQMYLLCTFEVTAGAIEILRHHAELHAISTQNVP